MADLEFVDPGTGAALGSHAYGTVAAGVDSTAWAIRLRYKWGQSGSGLNSNALLLEVSTDGGTTYRTDLAEFTLQVTSVTNVPNDPLFLGAATSVRRTTRLDLPALRAGCAFNISVVFSPTLRTGAATTLYTWRLGVAYNETFREISLNPDAPTGVLTGLGDASISEWVTAPTLANDTDKVTLGASSCVIAGAAVSLAGGDVTLNQDDGASAALGSGEEYIALLSAASGGTVTTTKGVKATAGTAVAPAYPVGELPLAVVRVPYGGVIVTSTLVAISGRCLVGDGGGRVVTVQPGRAVMPGVYLTPATVQSFTCPYASTVTIYLSPLGAANSTSGVPLASVTTVAGDITDITDLRTLLYQGAQSKLFATLDAGYNRITSVPHALLTTDPYDAPSWGSVMGLSVKRPVRIVADTDVATLSGEQTVDGYSLLEGHRVLLSNQATTTQNGIWVVHTTAWTRAQDCDSTFNCYAGIFVYCRFGTYAGQWVAMTTEMTDFTSDTQLWVPMVAL